MRERGIGRKEGERDSAQERVARGRYIFLLLKGELRMRGVHFQEK